MKDYIVQALLIVQLVFIGGISLIFINAIDRQDKKVNQLQQDVYSIKAENIKMQKELKNNNNIVLKILEKEW